MSAYAKADMSASGLLPCKLTPNPIPLVSNPCCNCVIESLVGAVSSVTAAIAKKATANIAGDPLRTGLVASQARQAGNITGLLLQAIDTPADGIVTSSRPYELAKEKMNHVAPLFRSQLSVPPWGRPPRLQRSQLSEHKRCRDERPAPNRSRPGSTAFSLRRDDDEQTSKHEQQRTIDLPIDLVGFDGAGNEQ
jgi:hypothetical protein